MGRYYLHDEIASGGMASIHIGRLQGPVGFSRTVAIKRLHAQFAKDPEFVSMFLDEARLAARVQHPNVVSTIDVIALGGELFLVMEYIAGETLSRLERVLAQSGSRLPLRVALGIMTDALYGLHAAHEATSEHGEPLEIVHRDVSPHNVIVGKDGVARVLDFGIAKAASRVQITRDGQVKGKLAYMAPEQLRRKRVDRRTDVFAASIVLWEALTGKRLFKADDEGGTVTGILFDPIPVPSSVAPGIPKDIDAIVRKGLERDPDARFATALEMASALEGASSIARPAEIGAYVQGIAGDVLASRAQRIAEIEGTPSEEDGQVDELVHTAERGASGTVRLEGSDGTHASHVTSLSRAPGAPRSRARSVWVVAGISALAGVAWLGGRAVTREPATLAAGPSTGARQARGAATAAPLEPPSPEPVALPPPTTSTPEAPPARAAASAHAPLFRSAPKPRVNPCDPPFFIDDAGVKRFKPQCI